MVVKDSKKTATKNACKLCTPLGACIALKGVKNAMPLLHGSQGCATYMRRYLIGHFKEPVDIASSNFTEHSTIFGGGQNLETGIKNVLKAYNPKLIGIATTCLTETIGEDVNLMLNNILKSSDFQEYPEIVSVSTASYSGTHIDGYYHAIREIVKTLAKADFAGDRINILNGLFSPADIRHIKEILDDFGIDYSLLPDYSETFDGASWETYNKIPEGGTELGDIKLMGVAGASIEFGKTFNYESAGSYLEDKMGIKNHRLHYPIGIKQTDVFFNVLEKISGLKTPQKYINERGRLVDSYVDGHKYVFGKKAIVFGEEDFVLGLVSFLTEIGIHPVLVASGGESGKLEQYVDVIKSKTGFNKDILVKQGLDFTEIEEYAKTLSPDLLIGNSKGYSFGKKIKVPLIRVGFPIHDRFGGQRILHIGYRGAQNLFDTIVNTIIEERQKSSDIGYSYM